MSLGFQVRVFDQTTSQAYAADIPLIQADVLYAGSVWASYINSDAVIDVAVNIKDASKVPTANGGAGTSVFLETVNGLNDFAYGTIYEMQTGRDPNGQLTDITINIGADFLTNAIYLDPNPSAGSSVPGDRIDAVETFEHELAHGLGINGFLNYSTGVATSGSMAAFDLYVSMVNGYPYFTGPHAEAVYGGPVPLTQNNLYHVGNPSGPGAELVSDIMNGFLSPSGKSPGPSALDVAILADIGIPTFTYGSPRTADDGRFGDFDSDGKADVLWQNADGTIATWQMTGAGPAASFFNGVPSQWHFGGIGDFDGDHKADILWVNSNSSVLDWQMASSSSVGSTPALPLAPQDLNSVAALAYYVAGVADFDGDGKSDILWRTDSNGAALVWEMDGSSTKGRGNNITSAGNAWVIVGTGDLTGDGKADVLLRHRADGVMAYWTWSTTGHTNPLTQSPNTVFLNGVPADWHVVAVGNFDGDAQHTDDVFWHNDNGANAIWLMGGSGQLQQAVFLNGVSADWHVVGSGDFDGDHKDDLLWRSDNGATAIWAMNGGSAPTVSFPGGVPSAWTTQAHHFDFV